MEQIHVAIDGPSGAGKSTVARKVAAMLGFLYVDTGAMYRAIGVYMRDHSIDPTDSGAVTAALPEVKVSLSYGEDGAQKVCLNGVDVSATIRENEISSYASKVSAIPQVRNFLLDLQRDIAKTNNVIMDGRDIGTVILPQAQVKIFLKASADARARRRVLELRQKGQEVSYEQILREMNQRDIADATREAAPLRPAPDALMLDNSQIDLEQTAEKIMELIREKTGYENN